jgi:periplasmic glucans biosynthesis protein
MRLSPPKLELHLVLAWLCLSVWAGDPPPPAGPAPTNTGFSFATVRERARQRAATEYRPEPNRLPEFLKKLSYDGYQRIRFRPETAPWYGESMPFTLQFFHPGFLYQDPVAIHLASQGRSSDFKFSPAQFDYGSNQFPNPVPADLGFAGLRVLYPVNKPGKQDEVVAFLGASYFRLVGARQRYGASARGLAIDTAESSGEEFPRFTEFWIHRPPEHAAQMELFALLDSPSLAGAYRFLIEPGNATLVDVEASLFLRKGVKKLGLAPLTSMFLMGASHTRAFPDFRPEVHDSDGLLIQTAEGEWLCRPLINPGKEHHVTRWSVDNPKGFGLAQRDRAFHDYEDLGARFDLRPSLWVTPRAGWGAGSVELVEIPTANEWNDNIVAYWVPKQPPVVGQEFRCAWTLSASLGDPDPAGLLVVQSTRHALAHDGKPPRFVVDFVGGDVSTNAAAERVEASIQPSSGSIRDLVLQQNEVTGGWRVVFDLAVEARPEGDLRLFLHRGGKVISEVWVYNWSQTAGLGLE